MKDIEVNGAHITDESAEILKLWQVKTEPVSACYIEVIEDLIDFLIEKGDESTPTNEVLRRIQLLRMMKKTSKSCLILNMNNLAYLLKKVSVKFKFQVRGCLCRGGSRHFFMSFSARLFLLTFVETIKIRNMTETIITAVVTAFCTGGLTWLFTLRYTRKQAEADAMKSVQEVYQKLIEDLKSDRQDLKKRFDELDNKYKEVLHKCNEMEKQSDRTPV